MVADQHGCPTAGRATSPRRSGRSPRPGATGAGAPRHLPLRQRRRRPGRSSPTAIFARDRLDARGRRCVPIATADYPTPARRPANSVLDCSRIDEAYGIAQPDWRAGAGRDRWTNCAEESGMSARASSWPAAPARGCIRSPLAVSKQLLPVYDKPMIYYPLSVLMLAGIREVADHHHAGGSGQLPAPARRRLAAGACASRTSSQPQPEGLAQAFILGEDFVAGEPVALVLGDKSSSAHDLRRAAARGRRARDGATVFAYRVDDPERYGVVGSTRRPRALDRGEAGGAEVELGGDRALFLRRQRVGAVAKRVKPRPAGELEITELLNGSTSADGLLRRAAGPRLRLARHRHPRQPARGGRVRARRSSSARACRSPASRRSPSPGLDHRRRAQGHRRAVHEDRVRPLPDARRRRGVTPGVKIP